LVGFPSVGATELLVVGLGGTPSEVLTVGLLVLVGPDVVVDGDAPGVMLGVVEGVVCWVAEGEVVGSTGGCVSVVMKLEVIDVVSRVVAVWVVWVVSVVTPGGVSTVPFVVPVSCLFNKLTRLLAVSPFCSASLASASLASLYASTL